MMKKSIALIGNVGGICIAVAFFMLLSLFTTKLGPEGIVTVAGVLFIGGALLRIEAAIRRTKSD
ncbi:hypothetical protein [Catellatospora sp. NPDC049133]|jgi:hypothetical protein|uniref:hypothetical protein n=1 Tax=Catellatospora sp. NPDC049133 TaxID=3155499 RepID=UPI0033E7A97B